MVVVTDAAEFEHHEKAPPCVNPVSFTDEQSQELHSYAEGTNKCPAKKVYQQKELLLCCAPRVT